MKADVLRGCSGVQSTSLKTHCPLTASQGLSIWAGPSDGRIGAGASIQPPINFTTTERGTSIIPKLQPLVCHREQQQNQHLRSAMPSVRAWLLLPLPRLLLEGWLFNQWVPIIDFFPGLRCSLLQWGGSLEQRRPHRTFKCVVPSVVGIDLPPVADKHLQPVVVLLQAVFLLVLKQNTSAISHRNRMQLTRGRRFCFLRGGLEVFFLPRFSGQTCVSRWDTVPGLCGQSWEVTKQSPCPQGTCGQNEAKAAAGESVNGPGGPGEGPAKRRSPLDATAGTGSITIFKCTRTSVFQWILQPAHDVT